MLSIQKGGKTNVTELPPLKVNQLSDYIKYFKVNYP